MPDEVERPIDYWGIVVMDDEADEVEVTDAMIAAGIAELNASDMTYYDSLRARDAAMARRLYRAMHAARTPVSVEEVAQTVANAMQQAREEIGASEQQRIAFAYAEAAMRSALPTALSTRP
jgi:hypothetical protein